MSTTEAQTIDVHALREAYSAAWAAHDPDAIARLHTEDTVFHTHVGTEPVMGREALRAACAEIFETYQNFSSEGHRLLIGDRHWVADWTLHARVGDKDISVDCVDVIALSGEGLVSRKDTYMDFAQLQAALS